MSDEPILNRDDFEHSMYECCAWTPDTDDPMPNWPECASRVAVSHEALRAEVVRLRTWDGVMAFLDEQYPADVFDGSSGDEGPRIIVLMREVVRYREALRELIEQFNSDEHKRGWREEWNAPGHSHRVRERWDGWGETRHQKPCSLCIAWNAARGLLGDEETR